MNDCVLLAVNGCVNSNGEDVLMVLCKDTRVDDIAVVAGFARINVDAAHNASRPGLDVDCAGLVELVRKHVLVVGESEDELHDKLALACDDGAACPPVGVLPRNTIVLFVQADDVGVILDAAIGVENV